MAFLSKRVISEVLGNNDASVNFTEHLMLEAFPVSDPQNSTECELCCNCLLPAKMKMENESFGQHASETSSGLHEFVQIIVDMLHERNTSTSLLNQK